MQFTTLDILYLALTFAVLVITICLAIFFSHATKVMKNAARISDDVTDMSSLVHHYFIMPFDAIKKIKRKFQENQEDKE